MKTISKHGRIRAGFKIETKELRQFLKKLEKTFKNTDTDQRPYCEITIKTNKVEFAITGIKQSIKCEAKGPAPCDYSLFTFSAPRMRQTKTENYG